MKIVFEIETPTTLRRDDIMRALKGWFNIDTNVNEIYNEKWEKEFEDKIAINCDDSGITGIELSKNNLPEIINEYFNIGIFDFAWRKIKIKCKKGCIQIERID